MNTPKIGIVILAAGGSTRFRSPKQLLQFGGKSLIRRAAEAAIEQNGCKVVAVISEQNQDIKDQIDDLAVEIIVNNDWQTGLSSSLKLGLTSLLDAVPDLSAAVFMLCDQPFVNSDTISRLIDAYKTTQKPIIAARYEKTLGVPALFDRTLFSELMDLHGDVGAKPIISKHAADVCGVDAPEAFFDIDRVGDYEELLKQE